MAYHQRCTVLQHHFNNASTADGALMFLRVIFHSLLFQFTTQGADDLPETITAATSELDQTAAKPPPLFEFHSLHTFVVVFFANCRPLHGSPDRASSNRGGSCGILLRRCHQGLGLSRVGRPPGQPAEDAIDSWCCQM